MQKRKFDELISHFNRKVADMSIDQKYKIELLGMISAIGFEHEKELGTDCISRQAVLNEFCHSCDGCSCNPNTCCKTEWIRKLPVIQPERKECEEREQGKCPWYSG